MDHGQLDSLIAVATTIIGVAVAAVVFKGLRRWLGSVGAWVACVLIVGLSTGVTRTAIDYAMGDSRTLRPENIQGALSQWKLMGFLKIHEPRLYEELTTELTATRELNVNNIRDLGHRFWSKHSPAIFAKYGPKSSDTAIIQFFRLQVTTTIELMGRSDSSCYWFLENDARGVKVAQTTIKDYNRLVDVAAYEFLHSAAIQPQSSPDPRIAERHLEALRSKVRAKVGDGTMDLIGRSDLTALNDQLRSCVGSIAWINEILSLETKTAGLVLRSFFQ